jgi:hypothetical protein
MEHLQLAQAGSWASCAASATMRVIFGDATTSLLMNTVQCTKKAADTYG